MSIHYGDRETLGIRKGNHTFIGIPRRETPFQTSTIFSPALVSDGYGIKNGEVPGGSEAYKAAHYPGQTGVTDAEELFAAIAEMMANSDETAATSQTVFLENDIYLNTNDYKPYTAGDGGPAADLMEIPAYCFLDGCGYTIYITYGQCDTSANSEQYWGGLVKECRGTIQNLSIYSTSWLNETRGSEMNYNIGIGLVVGTLRWGTVRNCYITWAGSNTFFNNKKSSSSRAFLGAVCGYLREGHILNTTVDLQACLTLNVPGQSGINKQWYPWVGGFAGMCNNTDDNNQNVIAEITNCTITGPGGVAPNGGGNNVGLLNWHNGTSSGSGYGRIGAFIGWLRQGCSFNNIKIAGTFDVICNTSQNNSRGLLVGGGEDYSFATDPQPTGMDFIWHSNNANNWFNRFNATDGSWVLGTTQWTRDKPCYYTYECSDDDFGFSALESNVLWFGKASSLEGRQLSTESDIKGSFVGKIRIDVSSTPNIYNVIERFVYTNKDVATSAKTAKSNIALSSAVTGDSGIVLKSISYGYYGYVANEQGTTAGTYKMYYNNGQTLDYQFERSPIVRIGIYEMDKLQEINNVTYYVTRNTDTGYYTE